MNSNDKKAPSFIVRFLIIFVPLLVLMFLMHIAGITDNLFMTVLLSLAVVWMIQAIYKRVLKKRDENAENE